MNDQEKSNSFYNPRPSGEEPSKSSQHSYPSQRQMASGPPKRPTTIYRPGSFGKVFQERVYIKIFIAGIIFLLVGFILVSVTGYMTAPDRDDYGDEYGDLDREDEKRYKDDLDTFNLIKKSVTTTGGILEQIGIILLVVGLFIGAVIDENLPPFVRLGMLIALGLIVGFKI